MRLGNLSRKRFTFTHGSESCTGSMVLASAPGEGLRKFPITTKGKGEADTLHGERGSKRSKKEIPGSFKQPDLTWTYRVKTYSLLEDGTKPFTRDPPHDENASCQVPPPTLGIRFQHEMWRGQISKPYKLGFLCLL